ncbi:hypothetical protein GN956_G4741 [Arapaima gigas]
MRQLVSARAGGVKNGGRRRERKKEREKTKRVAAERFQRSGVRGALAVPRPRRCEGEEVWRPLVPLCLFFFVLTLVLPPPPDPTAGAAAVQTHIIKPGLAGNVAGSQQEDVRVGSRRGSALIPQGAPRSLG